VEVKGNKEKENMSRTNRCCRTALLLVAAIFVLGTATAFAQVHTTGLPVTKSCPPTADSGTSYQCTFTVTNADDQHGVNNLVVTETAPFPGGTGVTVDCLQGGNPVTSLGFAGSGTESCGGSIDITAPINCSASNTFNQDQIAANGVDADTGQFANLPVSGAATNNTLTPPLVCNDGLFCTDDSCDPASGCVTVPHVCNDNLTCTTDTCNEETDGCDFTPVVCQQDADLCTLEACVEGQGCQSGTPTSCPDDTDLCNGTPACDPTTGQCDPTGGGDPVTCPDDADLCNGIPACVPATGLCDPTGGGAAVTCDDPVCTECNPTNGLCDLPADPLPTECVPGDEICRTPGFWGTHGGLEKSSSKQITGTVLDLFGGTLSICGVTVDSVDDALQAICVSPKGNSRLQLARQLTAAALNCGISNSTGTPGTCAAQDGTAACAGVSVEDVFNACNDACANDETTADVGGNTISCIGAIDCFNNGGNFDPATGNCNDATGESCHDRQLATDCLNFQPPGAAGSPRACNDARKDCTTIFGSQCP
jgi:hypothetical protein